MNRFPGDCGDPRCEQCNRFYKGQKAVTLGQRYGMTDERAAAVLGYVPAAEVNSKIGQVSYSPPTMQNVERALADGVPFRDVAPVGVSRAMYEAEKIRGMLREEIQKRLPSGLSGVTATLVDALAETMGRQSAAMYEAIEAFTMPPPKYRFPKTGRTAVNPPDANPPGQPSPRYSRAAAAQRMPGSAELTRSLDIKIVDPKACDCGGLAARTTHSDWCSSK